MSTVAQAGNPERYWYGVARSFMNYNTRQTLEKARQYHLAWKQWEEGDSAEKPPYDPIWHDFRGLFTHLLGHRDFGNKHPLYLQQNLPFGIGQTLFGFQGLQVAIYLADFLRIASF